LDRGGNLVIPAFSVGRTQELLFLIREIKQQGRIQGHDGFPVYVDSPLGIEATNVLNENTLECADEETMKLIKSGVNPITFDGLRIAKSADESKQINVDETPKVIISASGMCEAGRIRHHLKHNLWRPESTVLFVGYQAVGTLGRSLVDGATKVKLFGETIQVAAKIEQLAGKSGHADTTGLSKWASSFDPKPKHVFVVHGDDEVAGIFADRLVNELGMSANAPYNGESWQITPECKKLCDGNQVRLKKPGKEAAAMDTLPKKTPPAPAKAQQPKKETRQQEIDRSSAYGQLITAGEKMMDHILNRMKKASPRNQAKLTKQIHILLKKFK
ncbi:MAG: MBL fold metallo-hydrolase, partial [Clostridia bacterium]|nr:MBL fold metallo-hydrolase [Clostridia bacterium]